jgi:anaerobic magnesium-protoporphyrin IX monomethyl ester cyclase
MQTSDERAMPAVEPRARSIDGASRRVVLIGFQEQENLGLGYLASALRSRGHVVEIVDFEIEFDQILDSVRRVDPVVVGFSLIFQFYVRRFADLAAHLRANGVTCHFTIGGHFPSLSYQHTLELIPALDSVVRFEGELTLIELVDIVGAGGEWRGIRGVAYRDATGVMLANPLRPLVHDLDELPYPERSYKPNAVLGRKAVPILASRGCARTCSFCSIHVFYRSAPGKVVRTRKPVEVVREMRALHDEHDIRIFLFQDDDFPLFGPVWQRWTRSFLAELRRDGLADRVIWKINCRADAVDPELFREMKEAGLYYVYMGLESGSEEGLSTLNKNITVEENRRAVAILKQLGLTYEFGFMLFDPSTSFQSVRENVAFLRDISGDGTSSAGFCRMLPYDGTPIKDELALAGRLRGDVCDPDYEFLDPLLSQYFQNLTGLLRLTGWIHGNPGLTPQLKFAWNEVAIMERLFPPLPDLAGYQETLRHITAQSNEMLFRVIEDMAAALTDDRPHHWSAKQLRSECGRFLEQFHQERHAFVLKSQPIMLRALREDAPREAALA